MTKVIRTTDTKNIVVRLDSRSLVHRVERGPQGPRGDPGLSPGGAIPAIPFTWGVAPSAVFVPAGAGILTYARVKITASFDGAGATITVGTQIDPEAALPSAFVNPYASEEYENTPDIALAAMEGIWLYVTPGTATQGTGILFLNYLES